MVGVPPLRCADTHWQGDRPIRRQTTAVLNSISATGASAMELNCGGGIQTRSSAGAGRHQSLLTSHRYQWLSHILVPTTHYVSNRGPPVKQKERILAPPGGNLVKCPYHQLGMPGWCVARVHPSSHLHTILHTHRATAGCTRTIVYTVVHTGV